MDITALRKDYKLAALSEAGVEADPLKQFEKWFAEALRAQLPEPNAMTLATADREGRPSARIVLIKEVDAHGFVFFTNYQSRKGQDLAQNAYAALLFHWIDLERQVRIEGQVEKVNSEESEAYYRSRPLLSRIGAWASPQSQEIPDREFLEARMTHYQNEYGEQPPRPPHWGGYRLLPEFFEFWQGRPSRLHDRLCYQKADAGWLIQRLAP